jgi:hypothetical protein
MKKILGFATSFAFAASLAFASLTLPFFAGEAAAQLLNPITNNQGPGTFPCGVPPAGADHTCEGEVVIIECLEGCDVAIMAPVMTMVEFEVLQVYKITDGVVELTQEIVSFACCPLVVGRDIGPHRAYEDVDGNQIPIGGLVYPDLNGGVTPEAKIAGFGNLAGLEDARLIEQAEADAEDATVANALSLQQAEEEKACRGVPLALKHLLCAAKI